MKISKIYFFFSVLVLLLVILYIFRYETSSKIFSALDYNEQKARQYSFLLLEKPFKSLTSRMRAYISPKLDLEEVLNNTLEIKSGFMNYDQKNLEFRNGNYFFNIFEFSNQKVVDETVNNLKYSDLWRKKTIKKIWSISMSNKTNPEESSKDIPLIAQATPKICGEKLIYARQDGNIGAVDFRTGEKFWHRKFENVRGLRIKGLFCEYDKKLDSHVILYPTGSGVFCLHAADGSLIASRCKDGRLGGYESRVSPQLIDDTVYVATIRPSGIAAYNFLNGELKWRTEFEIGKFFLKGGSNPWNNFIIDQKNQILFINTGSPVSRFEAGSLEKYKYSGSLIALSLKNGKIIWQFQEILGDTGNLDLVGQPILLPKKIKGKEIVVTLSKSGSIYFIDREKGLPVFPIEEKTVNFGKFKYSFKQSTAPQPLFDKNYINYLGENYKSNTFAFGYLPPILKIHRISNAEVFQWPGGSLDKKNNYLILSSNHNKTTELYTDFEPDPPSSFSSNLLIQKCTSCHDSKGKVKVVGKKIIPSLFLTSEIYTHSSLKKYLNENRFHKELDFDDKDLLQAYSSFENYDKELIKEKKFRSIHFYNHTGKINKEIYLESGILGKITAISLDTGEIIWQIPAGTYRVNENRVLIGSPNYGGIASIEDRDNQSISFFTGSYDKKIYAINNENGNYVWSDDLPASGSSIPLIYEVDDERWIFVVATGGRVKGDSSDSVVAFKQKLN